MDNSNFESWGRFPRADHLGGFSPRTVRELADFTRSAEASLLPRGLGRSYGDSCLNEGGFLLFSRHFDKLSEFDDNTGVLKCESGVTLDEIIRVFLPKGWFPPVTPGTKFVTVGGAIANDVHGKNHHRSGSFGNHILRFELERSDGQRIICSREANREMFRATIGGLGLTGIILWAEFTLKKVSGPYIDMESIKFTSLDEFFTISNESVNDSEYTVAWLDCINSHQDIMGVYMRGNHSSKPEDDLSRILPGRSPFWTVPFSAPSFVLSPLTMRLYNFVQFHRQKHKALRRRVHYELFFYPLDAINHWNRLYGSRGFLQWQCVMPLESGPESVRHVFQKIMSQKIRPYLAVIKEFGGSSPAGMLSFPMRGITIALDFSLRHRELFSFLDDLDETVVHYGGRIYPAKDARMSAATFTRTFPELMEFRNFIDPKLSSSFIRRVFEAQ